MVRMVRRLNDREKSFYFRLDIGLPMPVKLILSRWLAGDRVFDDLSDRTFYRHRKFILVKYDVDISLPYDKESQGKLLVR